MLHISSTPRMLLRLLIILVLSVNIINQYSILYAQDVESNFSLNVPAVIDPRLKVEKVTDGLKIPTGMAFIGPDDILIIQKNNGTVERITNGNKLPDALLDVNVSHAHERGMLGIAVAPNHDNNSNPYVFLYFTKSNTNGDEKIFNSTYSVSNHLYRYELVNHSKLQNPKLLLSTPPTNASYHQGGKLVIGPDHNLYATIGDQNEYKTTNAQNINNGTFPDTTSSIIRMTFDGKAPPDKILGKVYPLDLYYAYGIRNSFGIDFDPVTGKLWDTEDGPSYGDEVNLVEPGFNSGWSRVQGVWKPIVNLSGDEATIGNVELNPQNLVDFDGKGKYSKPEFTWKIPACVSAIKFLNSDKYGKEYENDAFVASSIGNLYHFDMNKERTGFILNKPLNDKIADTNSHDELDQVLFGSKFGEGITDMQVSPYDGLLYVSTEDGAIYRIVPK
jgi:aldose sugar dehydrogenase